MNKRKRLAAIDPAKNRELAEELTTLMAYVVTVHILIDDAFGEWKRGGPSVAGRINCPKCGQKDSLRFSRSDFNGHVRAQCDTENCLQFMQ
jgi:hypothetical protein